MTFYQQEEAYYCAPACVKMMLKYLTGDAYAQESLATLMGTNEQSGTSAARIAPCLNSIQDEFYYVRENQPDEVVMKNYIYSTVAYNRVPAEMGIVTPSGEGWHYATEGHGLVVCGIYSDESMIQFMDPFGGTVWLPNCPSVCLKAASPVSDICRDLIW